MSVQAFRSKSALMWGASAVVLASAVGLAPQAHAQTAKAAAPPEVVVTAERRTTNIQKTAVAISAVSGATLDQSFVTQVADLNASVPSLEITHTSGQENLVTIRGVGSETPENSQSTSPGVSVFEDGVYLVNSLSLDQTLFDVEHIEVLRGPQGDLFGESSIGGSINIVSKAPQLHTYGGQFDLSGGDYSLFRGRGEVNAPLGDTAAIRMSVQKFDHDGFAVDTDPNLKGFREDDAHDVSGKASLLWKPIDTFTAQVTAEGYLANTNGAEQKNINDPNSDPRKFQQDYPNQFNLATELYHANLEWEAPWAIVRSVTGFQQLYHGTREDSSRSSFSLLGSYDDDAVWTDVARSYTEEFDLLSKPGSPVDWIVGAFAINDESQAKTVEYEGPFNSCATDPGPIARPSDLNVPANISTHPTCNLSYGNISTSTKQGAAAFFRLGYHILPNLRVSAGARYNWDRTSNSSYNFSQYGIGTTAVDVAAATPTWRVEADYDLTPTNLIYASLARGYKPGGANGSPCSGGACHQVVGNTFLAETNDGFEVGSKNQFLDRTLTVNMSAFYYDHRNFQYIEQDPVPFADGMANIPHVRDYGAEFEAHYRSDDTKLHLDGSLALEKGEVIGKYLTIDSTISDAIEGPSYSGGNAAKTFPPGPCLYGAAYGYQYANPVSFANGGNSAACWAQVEAGAKNIQGKSPPAEPNVSGSISGSYDFDMSAGTITPWVQLVYRGQEWARIFNEPSLDNVPAYTVVNMNAAFVPNWDKRWKLTLTATNVANTVGINSQYTDPYGTAATSRQYIAPRQIIGTVAFVY